MNVRVCLPLCKRDESRLVLVKSPRGRNCVLYRLTEHKLNGSVPVTTVRRC